MWFYYGIKFPTLDDACINQGIVRKIRPASGV